MCVTASVLHDAFFSSIPETGSDQPNKPPSRKPRGGTANVAEEQEEQEEEGASAPGEAQPVRDEGFTDREAPVLPPQWDKALDEGTGLEEGFCSGVSGANGGGGQQSDGASTPVAAASSGVNANHLEREEQPSEARAGAGGAPEAGEYDVYNSQVALSIDGSESTVRSTGLTDGMESIHRWLQVGRNMAWA